MDKIKEGDRYWHPVLKKIVTLTKIHPNSVRFKYKVFTGSPRHENRVVLQDRDYFESMCVPEKIYNSPLWKALNG